jgi:hypothetical protein
MVFMFASLLCRMIFSMVLSRLVWSASLSSGGGVLRHRAAYTEDTSAPEGR